MIQNISSVVAKAGFVFGLVLASSHAAQAACSNPTANLRVSSPGQNAGVVIGVATLDASGSTTDNSCSSNFTTSIYIDNRYVGSSRVNYDTRAIADGVHRVSVEVRDSQNNSGSTTQNITIRNNWVRPEVFDLGQYMELNDDVRNAFGGNAQRCLDHWLYFGVREGRPSNYVYAGREYMANYGDLQNAFGATNYPQALEHYLLFGKNEGRAGNFLVRPEVFNAQNYLARYGDLQAAFGGNTDAAKQHWAQYGSAEGRRASDQFHSVIYMQRYGDLQAAFGATNYRAGVTHYIQYGLSEGRSGQ